MLDINTTVSLGEAQIALDAAFTHYKFSIQSAQDQRICFQETLTITRAQEGRTKITAEIKVMQQTEVQKGVKARI